MPHLHRVSRLGEGGSGKGIGGNGLKVKNKANNLGNLVILTYLGQVI